MPPSYECHQRTTEPAPESLEGGKRVGDSSPGEACRIPPHGRTATGHHATQPAADKPSAFHFGKSLPPIGDFPFWKA